MPTRIETMLTSIIAMLCKRTKSPLIEWDELSSAFDVQVDGEDQGRLIGKAGKVIWAISTLTRYAGFETSNRMIRINLLEPDHRVSKKSIVPFKANEKWDRQMIKDGIKDILAAVFNGQSGIFETEETDEFSATITFFCEVYLKDRFEDVGESENNLEQALDVIVHAIGMANGARLKTKFEWN